MGRSVLPIAPLQAHDQFAVRLSVSFFQFRMSRWCYFREFHLVTFCLLCSWGGAHIVRNWRQFAGLNEVALNHLIEQFRLFRIALHSCFQHPEQLEQFGRELSGPAHRPDFIQRRSASAGPCLHPVAQPRLYNLETRDLKFVNFRCNRGKSALSNVKRLICFVVFK